MQVELKQIQRDLGITFIFVTHDQEEALTLSDRIAVFNAGRHRAARHAARALRAAGIALRRRLRRHLEPLRPRPLDSAHRPRGRAHDPPREADAVARAGLGGGRALGAGHGRRVDLRRQRASGSVVDLDAGGRVTVLERNDRSRAADQDRGRSRTRELARLGRRRPHTPGNLTRENSRGHSPRRTAPRGRTMRHITRGARSSAVAALAIGAVVALTACGTSSGGGTASEEATELGEMEGSVSILAWPGYVEDGSNDPAVDWVSRLRGGDRLHGRVQDLRHLRRGGQSHEDGRVRRGCGIRRRHSPPHRRRRRRPGEHRPDPELRGHLRLPEGSGVELGRRRLVRRAPRLRRQPAAVQHGRRDPGADLVGRRVRQGRATTPARSPRTTRRSTSRMPRCT